MSEFKFACPVCGQHITAQASAAGSQLECPTCYRKIVVPQAPASADPKFVLSAAEANKPRPPQASGPSALGPMDAKPVKTTIPVAVLVVVLSVLCVAGIAAFFLLKKHRKPTEPPAEIVQASPEPGPPSKPAVQHPPSSNVWTLDLERAVIPEATASGRILGRDFYCERAFLQGGVLALRQGQKGQPELSFTVKLYGQQDERLAGQTITIVTNAEHPPPVSLSFKEPGQAPVSQNFTGGYALRIEFGPAKAGKMSGMIYFATPDESNSCAAGKFNAVLRKPAVPKPPKPKKPTP